MIEKSKTHQPISSNSLSDQLNTNEILNFGNIDIDFIRISIDFFRSRCHFSIVSNRQEENNVLLTVTPFAILATMTMKST